MADPKKPQGRQVQPQTPAASAKAPGNPEPGQFIRRAPVGIDRKQFIQDYHGFAVSQDAEGRIYFEAPVTDETLAVLEKLPENPREWTTRQAGLVGGSTGGTRTRELVQRGYDFEANGGFNQIPENLRNDEFVQRCQRAYAALIDRNQLPDDPGEWTTVQAGLTGGSRTRALVQMGFLSLYLEYKAGTLKMQQGVAKDQTKEGGVASANAGNLTPADPDAGFAMH